MAAELRTALALTVGLSWAAGSLAALPAPGPQPPAGATAAKPSRLAAKTIPTHWWHDGALRRPLTLDASLEAHFGPDADPRTIRPTRERSPATDALVSPVLRDDLGRLRALPGGVLVVLRAPLPETDARRLIESAGARPVRALGARLWLLEAPVGLAALELANRLHAGGLFESAQPNWWVARTLK